MEGKFDSLESLENSVELPSKTEVLAKVDDFSHQVESLLHQKNGVILSICGVSPHRSISAVVYKRADGFVLCSPAGNRGQSSLVQILIGDHISIGHLPNYVMQIFDIANWTAADTVFRMILVEDRRLAVINQYNLDEHHLAQVQVIPLVKFFYAGTNQPCTVFNFPGDFATPFVKLASAVDGEEHNIPFMSAHPPLRTPRYCTKIVPVAVGNRANLETEASKNRLGLCKAPNYFFDQMTFHFNQLSQTALSAALYDRLAQLMFSNGQQWTPLLRIILGKKVYSAKNNFAPGLYTANDAGDLSKFFMAFLHEAGVRRGIWGKFPTPEAFEEGLSRMDNEDGIVTFEIGNSEIVISRLSLEFEDDMIAQASGKPATRHIYMKTCLARTIKKKAVDQQDQFHVNPLFSQELMAMLTHFERLDVPVEFAKCRFVVRFFDERDFVRHISYSFELPKIPLHLPHPLREFAICDLFNNIAYSIQQVSMFDGRTPIISAEFRMMYNIIVRGRPAFFNDLGAAHASTFVAEKIFAPPRGIAHCSQWEYRPYFVEEDNRCRLKQFFIILSMFRSP